MEGDHYPPPRRAPSTPSLTKERIDPALTGRTNAETFARPCHPKPSTLQKRDFQMTTSNTTGPAPGEPTAQIIQFSALAAKARKPTGSHGSQDFEPSLSAFITLSSAKEVAHRERKPLPEPQTETCRNQRLRNARKDAWNRARWTTDYFHGLLKWRDILSCAQRAGVPEAVVQPAFDSDERWRIVAEWRAALVKQMLTPAPDLLAVTWKRTHLDEIKRCDVKPERVECAIAADAEWLAAHPTRAKKGGQ
jgi:hypothetical protein